jgi:hypothetical protein
MSRWIVRPAVILFLLSSELAPGEDRTAALHVTLDPTACRAVDEIGAYHVTTRAAPDDGRFIDKALVGQSAVTADCSWNLSELEPGEYEVWFQHKGAKMAIRTFALVPGQTADVALKADVVVTGFVTFNGAAFGGVTVEFTQKHGSRDQLAEAVTDAAGNYQVFLANEGPYTLVFRRDLVIGLGQDREGVAHRGNNRADWLLEGGTMKVMPVEWDRKEKLQLLIERKGPRIGTWYGAGVPVEPDKLPLTVTGLGFGTYEMRWMAYEDGTTVSDAKTVIIDPQNSEPSLELAVTGPQPR